MTPEEAELEARRAASRTRRAEAELEARRAASRERASAPAPAPEPVSQNSDLKKKTKPGTVTSPPAPPPAPAPRVDFSAFPAATVRNVPKTRVQRALEAYRVVVPATVTGSKTQVERGTPRSYVEPLETEFEQSAREAEERLDIPAEREAQIEKRPLSGMLGSPYQPESDVLRRQAASRGAVSTTAERDKEYFEQREGLVPFLRPTRIETLPAAVPGAGTERVVRETVVPFAEPVARAPTEREELVEAFARQPTLTREAARRVAEGEEVGKEERQVGVLEGARIETPAEAVFRAAMTSVPQMARQAYQAVAPTPERVASIPGAAAFVEAARKASQYVPDVFSVRVPLAEDLPDTQFAESLRKGETLADVMLADAGVMADAERRFGADEARARVENTGLLLELALPLTPFGLPGVAQGGRLLGRAVQGAAGAVAASKVEKEIVRRVWDAAVRETPMPKGLTADTLRAAYDAVPVELRVDPDFRLAEGAEAKIKAEAARARPGNDLVRVSPQYAVPRAQVARAKAAADQATSAYVERARSLGAEITPQAVGRVRDRAVYDAVSTQVRALDELGQYQVVLDGLENERAWSQVVSTLAALRDPVAATKRASIEAAEREVARKGQQALRVLGRELREIVRTSNTPITASQALGRVAERELGEMVAKADGAEVFTKVVEETFGGGPVGAQWRETALDAYRKLYPGEPLWRVIEPDRTEKLYQYMRGTVQGLPLLRPRYVQNSLKIVIEEGVRKRVAKEAKAAYEARYGTFDVGRGPLLAAENRAFLAEEARFVENGGEELFRLSESLPTRAGGEPLPAGEALSTLAAGVRSARTTLGYGPWSIPVVAAGESVMAPIRALAYTGILGTPYRPALIKTPMGTFTAREVDELIGSLGGVGMTRADVERTGRQAHDLFRAVEQEVARAQGRTAETAARKAFAGTPAALSIAATVEEEARRAVFIRAMQRGQTPEAAIATARRSQYDWGDARNAEIVTRISDEFVWATKTVAEMTELLDLAMRSPAAYRAYLRAKDRADRQFDELNQIESPDGRKLALPPMGQKQVLVDLPFQPPVGVLIQPLRMAEAVAQLPLSPEAAQIVLQGGADAIGEYAQAVGDVAEAFGGEGEAGVEGTLQRGEPSIEQLYLSVLAAAKMMDPTGRNEFVAALNYLDPVYARPPKDDVGFPNDPLAWRGVPANVPAGSYVVSVLPEGDRDTRYYVLRPSGTGLRKLRALRSVAAAAGFDGITRNVIAAEKALSGDAAEAGLWLIGAETVEDPTARAVDVTRP